LAYTAKTKSDYSVAVVLATVEDGRCFVLDVVREQMEAPAFCEKLKELKRKYAAPMRWYASGTESGSAQFLKAQGLPIEVLPPLGDKFVRAQGVSAAWNSGRVLIPKAAPFVTAKHAAELVAAGLWEQHPDGFLVHDFLEYNPSAAELDSKRHSKAIAGAKGAASRWHGDRKWQTDAPVPDPSPTPISSASASAREDEGRTVLDEAYYRHFGHDPTSAIRHEMENLLQAHGDICFGWVLGEVGGMAPDKRNWRIARFKFNDCATEGHGPRYVTRSPRTNGGGRSVRAGNGADQRRPEGVGGRRELTAEEADARRAEIERRGAEIKAARAAAGEVG
jgi:predicted phage terminase large subunit-like protein